MEENEFAQKQDWCMRQIADLERKETDCLKALEGLSDTEAAAKKVDLCDDLLSQISLHILISNMRLSSRSQIDEGALENARKCISKVISTLEELVSTSIDIPFSESAEKTAVLSAVGLRKRLSLMQKIGISLDLIALSYGENQRLKWLLVDHYGHFSAIVKNFVDVGKVIKSSFDIGSADCETCRKYIRVMKFALEKAVSAYSDRFDFSSRSPDDLRLAANYATIYSRILTACGATSEAENMKKKANFLREKFEANLKAQETKK